jgi:predicted outer membrane repeat protein
MANTTPSFDHCTFSDNTASWDAGGIYLDGCSPDFFVCHFDGNSVTDAYGRGGGMYLVQGASPTLSGCTFTENSSTWYGGAVMIAEDCVPSFSGVLMGNNTSEYGGAVAMYGDIAPAFDTCWFYDNTAVYAGGGVHSSEGPVPTFDDCTFNGNTAGTTGGAMHVEYLSTPELTGCTLHANSAPTGSGVWCDDNFTLTNSIIVFGVGGAAVHCDGDAPYVSCCDIYGNAGGDWVGCLAGGDLVDNNFSEDPLFCGASSGNFYLDVASPCTAANAPSCDLIGAWGIDCDTPVQAQSWGAIKAMYR